MRVSLVLLLVTMAGIVLGEKNYEQLWEEWKATHERSFNTPQEEAIGFQNFKQRGSEIDQRNELYKQGKSTWQAGFNSMSHLSHADSAKRNGFKKDQSRKKRSLSGLESYDPSNSAYPIFRTYTAASTLSITDTAFNVTFAEPVQNQGLCGNCYSFAAGSVLAYYQQQYQSTQIVVSRQDIVDCSVYLGNGGCDGGDPGRVLEYFIMNKTSVNSAYPFILYTNPKVPITTESCQTQLRTGTLYGIDTTKYNMMQINPDTLSLKSALKSCGAVAVSIYVDPNPNDSTSLENYKSGIFTCSNPGQNDHAVTLIGWGTSSSGTNYWIIKNSWGTSWGMAGYFQLEFENCGITGSSYSAAWAICPNTFS